MKKTRPQKFCVRVPSNTIILTRSFSEPIENFFFIAEKISARKARHSPQIHRILICTQYMRGILNILLKFLREESWLWNGKFPDLGVWVCLGNATGNKYLLGIPAWGQRSGCNLSSLQCTECRTRETREM